MLIEDNASIADLFVEVIKGEMTKEAFSDLLGGEWRLCSRTKAGDPYQTPIFSAS